MTREEAIKLLCVEKSTIVEVDGNKGAEKMLQAYDMAIDALEQEPVKHGEWITDKDGYSLCSECGFSFGCIECPHEETDFCPNCGADMRKKGGEDHEAD